MKGYLKLISGKRIQSPKGLGTRPTTGIVREALINILGEKINNSHWLDLCSGSGIISCEAIQRGAKRVLAIESNKKTAQICKTNLLNTFEISNKEVFLEIYCCEILKALKRGCENSSFNFIEKFPKEDPRFDFVYIDPPYKNNILPLSLERLILGKWIKKDSLVIYEHSSEINNEDHNGFSLLDTRRYGKANLTFFTPNQA